MLLRMPITYGRFLETDAEGIYCSRQCKGFQIVMI
jgi:hypothetical protein